MRQDRYRRCCLRESLTWDQAGNNFPNCSVLGAMLSVLREHEKPRHRHMLTEYREHGTREIVPGLFLDIQSRLRLTSVRRADQPQPSQV